MSLEDETFPLDEFMTDSLIIVENRDSEVAAGADKNEKEIGRHSGQKQKASSYLDKHSAYTKSRYKHVVSKVGQYIEAINVQDRERRNRVNKCQQQHWAMRSESHNSAEELHKLNMSSDNSSGAQLLSVDSYERMQHEMKSMQTYIEYLEQRLHTKIGENVLFKQNFGTMRSELDDCKKKLKEQRAIDCTMLTAKGSQTDLQWPSLAVEQTQETSCLPGTSEVANSAAPFPIVSLASADPATAYASNIILIFQQILPNVNKNKHTNNVKLGTIDSQPIVTTRVVTNNSISSNDSAIDLELELRYKPQNAASATKLVADASQIELDTSQYNSSSTIAQKHNSCKDDNLNYGSKRMTLINRLLRLLGPCGNWQDTNNSFETNTTAESELPLKEAKRVRENTLR